MDEPICVWDGAAELGEGALWDPDTLSVWFVDILQETLHRYHSESGAHEQWAAPNAPGFILRRAAGKFIVGLADGLYTFDPVDGSFAPRLIVGADHPENRLNDGTVGPDGALWFGSKNEVEDEASGLWYRWAGESEAAVFDSGYVVTNGPAFSPDGHRLYHSDSVNRLIYARTVSRDGEIGSNELFAEIESGVGFPDGLATDVEGCLWVALWAGAAVRRDAADGTLLAHIDVPAINVTKPAFGGAGGTTLYLSSARTGANANALVRYPMSGGLFAFDAGVAGSTVDALAF